MGWGSGPCTLDLLTKVASDPWVSSGEREIDWRVWPEKSFSWKNRQVIAVDEESFVDVRCFAGRNVTVT